MSARAVRTRARGRRRDPRPRGWAVPWRGKPAGYVAVGPLVEANGGASGVLADRYVNGLRVGTVLPDVPE